MLRRSSPDWPRVLHERLEDGVGLRGGLRRRRRPAAGARRRRTTRRRRWRACRAPAVIGSVTSTCRPGCSPQNCGGRDADDRVDAIAKRDRLADRRRARRRTAAASSRSRSPPPADPASRRPPSSAGPRPAAVRARRSSCPRPPARTPARRVPSTSTPQLVGAKAAIPANADGLVAEALEARIGRRAAARPRFRRSAGTPARAAARPAASRSSTVSTRLKIAVFAPMPSASESTAVSAKPGERAQQPQRVADVLDEIFEQPDAPGVAALLGRQVGRAELAPRRAPRLGLAHAPRPSARG